MQRVSDTPIPFGKLELCARDYNEFVCSKSTAQWLIEGGMTHLDGKRVWVQVMDELAGGHNVICHIWEKHGTD